MDPRTPTSSQTDALSDLVRRMQSLEETAFDEFVDAYAAGCTDSCSGSLGFVKMLRI